MDGPGLRSLLERVTSHPDDSDELNEVKKQFEVKQLESVVFCYSRSTVSAIVGYALQYGDYTENTGRYRI